MTTDSQKQKTENRKQKTENSPPHPLRIAIIQEAAAPTCRPVTLPFALGGYPRLEVEHFAPADEALAGPLPTVPVLQPEHFDLILDSGEWSARLPDLAWAGWPHLITGPPARLLEGLVCQLEELGQKQEINVGIIHSATDAIITIDEEHIIVGYNRGAEEMFGYSRGEALGQDLKIIIPPPHKEVHREYVQRFIDSREPRVIGKHVRLTAQRRDGTEFPMSISFSVAEVRGNLYFTGVIRDITEQQDMEARLIHSERLAAIGNTITHIAHEIKNPLLVIGGFARQLLKAAGLDDKSRQKLGIMATEVSRLEAMLTQMRDFVRRPEPQKQTGPLEPVLDEALQLFQDTLEERRIQVHRVTEGPLPAVSFDPKQLHQVLVNLLKNALEAMPEGGDITLTTRVRGANVEIAVTDTGAGMTPEVVANIFQPYFSTKEKGTGLGLAICQSIVQEHGGCLMADSAPGQGSTFTIQLPLEVAAATPPPPESS